MEISVRKLFSRPNIASSVGWVDDEIISVHNSLANHHQGLERGLRDAYERFLKPNSGDGYRCGCNTPSQKVAGELAYVVPSWVAVDNQETRVLEGTLTTSKITHTDFPLYPWHIYYDWNFYIKVDEQYTYLHSESNVKDHGNVIECEWDTGHLPSWTWPQDGDRIWMVGRWIYDCGHPENHGHKTEIHPPKAFASFRSEAVIFDGNQGPTRANNAIFYIGRNGGYWRHSINDQDYAFDLYLPPQPYPSAKPVWKIISKTGDLPVQLIITPYPLDEPKVLRVRIPLKDTDPHPEQYGAIISGGWSDPNRTESAKVRRVLVTITKIYMDGDYDTFGDEWYVYIGINGRWKVYKRLGGDSKNLDFEVILYLHQSDEIHITACGFEADALHGYMGDDSGYSWSHISNPSLTQKQRESIEDKVFKQLAGSFNDQNEPIGRISRYHNPSERGTFTEPSKSPKDYRLVYTIQDG